MTAPRNERLLPVFAWFSYPFAAVPFLFFWFQERGIGQEQYGRLIAIYYATMVLAEVPTGMLADRLGRKLVMVLGPAILAASFTVLWLSHSELGFAAGEVLFGLGHALLSGAPAAMLYDSLAARDRQHMFIMREGAIHAARLHGTGAAFLLGGGLAAAFGLGVTLPLSAGLCLIGSATALLMVEPRPQRRTHRLPPPASPAIIRTPWRREILWVTAYYVLLFCLLRYGFHNYQPYLDRARDQLRAIGPLWPLAVGAMFFGLNVVAAECSRFAPSMLRRHGHRRLLWTMPLLMSAGIGVMGLPLGLWGVAVLLVQQIPFGMHWPVVQDLINRRIPSHNRTTVLSAVSLAGRLGFALLAWPLFALQEHWSQPGTYVVAAVLGIAATAAILTVGGALTAPDRRTPRGSSSPGT